MVRLQFWTILIYPCSSHLQCLQCHVPFFNSSLINIKCLYCFHKLQCILFLLNFETISDLPPKSYLHTVSETSNVRLFSRFFPLPSASVTTDDSASVQPLSLWKNIARNPPINIHKLHTAGWCSLIGKIIMHARVFPY